MPLPPHFPAGEHLVVFRSNQTMYVPPLQSVSFLSCFSDQKLTLRYAIVGSGIYTLENPNFIYLLIASETPLV